MITHLPRVTLVALCAVLVSAFPAAAGVEALFDMQSVSTGPFPSDRFTVSDDTQNTRLRVNLPKPDCAVRVSDCLDIDLLNELDGFNVQPRVSIPFSGPIDIRTVNEQSVFLLALGNSTPRRDEDDEGDDQECRSGHVLVGLNELVWDVETNTLHGIANEMLEQHAHYALIVTRGVRDAAGHAVEASAAFARFRHDLNFGHIKDPRLKVYRTELVHALARAADAGIRRSEIVTASVFTTQSVTASLEKIRDQIKAGAPDPADFLLAPGGTRTVFPAADVAGITVRNQVGTAPLFSSVVPRLPLLRVLPEAPNIVGTIASGKFKSPIYTRTPESVMPPVGTRTGTPQALGTAEVFFSLFLPSGPSPAGGWPVVIFGSVQPDDAWNTSFNLAASLAKEGLATLTIQTAGGGFGPLSTITVRLSSGAQVTFPTGGRSFDQDGDGDIEAGEGTLAAPPREILGSRDSWRQTVADMMQLVRVIEVGIDADGDGLWDLDPSRIYYVGSSGGSWRGTAFAALEPAVRASVLNVVGFGRGYLSTVNRPFIGRQLSARTPSLINPAGSPVLTSIDGVPVGPPFFNDNLPLRDQPPVINTVAGAMDIQRWVDDNTWLNRSAEPVAFAPYFRKRPLPGVSVRPMLAQFVRGDQNIPNPSTTAFLRSGDLADRATFFRNDLAWAANPDPTKLEKNTHAFLLRMNTPERTVFALAAQRQVAVFFGSDGAVVLDPDGIGPLFETPAELPLPEDLGFIP